MFTDLGDSRGGVLNDHGMAVGMIGERPGHKSSRGNGISRPNCIELYFTHPEKSGAD